MTRHKNASFVNLHALSVRSKMQFDTLEETGWILAFMVPCWILMVVFILALVWLT